MTVTTTNATALKPRQTLWAPKRVLDLVLCLIALPAILPIFCLVGAVIVLTSKGPAFFVQKRVGRHGQTFSMYKFRSMYIDAEERRAEVERLSEREGVCVKVKNDPRVTPVGRALRRWSVDELPQLINVLRGDMSLVGPRPALICEVEQYPDHAHARHDVLPGITGLWQVSGRADVGFDEMILMDLEYVRRVSVLTDLSILLRTCGVVVTGRGAY